MVNQPQGREGMTKRLQGHIQETASASGAVSCEPIWLMMSDLCLQKCLIMDNADVQVTLCEMQDHTGQTLMESYGNTPCIIHSETSC